MPNLTLTNAHFHHIALKVSDFDRSFRFYTEGLGLTPYLQWGEGDSRAAMLDLGDGGYIEMFAGGHNAECPENAAGCFFHLAIGVDDPDAAYARALHCGAVSKTPPMEAIISDGQKGQVPLRIAFVSGPDGETLEFFRCLA